MWWPTIQFSMTTKLHTKTCVQHLLSPCQPIAHSNDVKYVTSSNPTCITSCSVALHNIHYFLYVKSFRHISLYVYSIPWFDVCRAMNFSHRIRKYIYSSSPYKFYSLCCNSSLVLVIIWKDKYKFCTYWPLQTSIVKLETADFSETLVSTYKNCTVL
jgi:hypothetical protein